MECVGLTESTLVHKSIVVSEPPRFQKSGPPTTFASESSVELGQMFPGSRPAERRCASIRNKMTVNRANISGALRSEHRSSPLSDWRIGFRQPIDNDIFFPETT